MRLPGSYKVPLCVPWWSGHTLAAIARAVAGGQIIAGPATARLEERLAAYCRRPVLACGNGRTAIELALRLVGVGAGDEVVIPTFCCTSIVPPILVLGARPVFADIGPTLSLTPETVAAALSARTRAVIVPHLFGKPAPIDAIAAVCAARQIAVIDDAAQALGAALDGRPLGTLGAAGLVSFGNGKVCFGTGGGILVVPDRETRQRAAAIPVPTERPDAVLVRALGVLVWRRWRRWSLPLERAGARLPRKARPPQAYRATAMAALDAAVALTLLDTLDANLAARRARVGWYADLLGSASGVRLIPHANGSACLTQVVEVAAGAEAAVALRHRLHGAGYEVSSSYAPLHQRPDFAHLTRAPLPVAERLAPSLLELPCEPSVPGTAVAAIADIVRGGHITG